MDDHRLDDKRLRKLTGIIDPSMNTTLATMGKLGATVAGTDPFY